MDPQLWEMYQMNVLPDAVVIRLSGSSLTFANDGNDALYWLKNVFIWNEVLKPKFNTEYSSNETGL